jgi:tRNA-dihydrouridine synthase B
MIRHTKNPVFFVDHIPIYGNLVLAPMAGFSDSPFRTICREFGSAMSYSEFINAMDILQSHPIIQQKVSFVALERPVVFQLFDNDPERLLEAAIRLQDLEPDILDVNLGCSARRVSSRGAGAGLLQEPNKVARIFDLLSNALDIPISAKMRLGWDQDTRNYLQIARIIQENGGKLLAVHGRTRRQGYSGKADWDAIAEIKQALSIPVIANGDVRKVEDIEKIRTQTGCDAVMIGRAAIGNPWLFSMLNREQVPVELFRKTIFQHFYRVLDFYGTERGLLLFRKHASRYLDLSLMPREKRKFLLSMQRPEEFIQIVGDLLS